ncbi:movement protein [Common oak ringspot-associated virus]|uniref:Movement protein n=1 Tax=Common oak ringspot-associated virus TaxID=2742449 RepID=A0A7G2A2M4_9VIRU|nr:movement protein [Common oak ringspot-associated virus]CAD0281688.1 movement protein [Common oak ringspot-associated virus]
MAFMRYYVQLFSFAFLMQAVPSNAIGTTVDDPIVIDHDISDWNSNNKDQELTEAVVDGLAATVMKKHLEVAPNTQVLMFTFYNHITEFLRKYVNGMKTTRIASIVIHYKPHTDACTGTVSFALVDQRFSDKLDVKAKINDNGNDKIKANSKKTILGKIHQLVTVKCNSESIVQMSMNYFVTVQDLKKIKLVQIVSGNNLISGTLATISLGWKTIPGDATVYEPYHAQRYYIPRMKMPELVGKDDKYVYNSIVKMAKDRHNMEIQMLNKLQELVDGQNVINNDLDTDLKEKLIDVQSRIDKHRDEIEKLDKAIPEKQRLIEANKELEMLEKARLNKLIEFQSNELNSDSTKKETVTLNDDDIVSMY